MRKLLFAVVVALVFGYGAVVGKLYWSQRAMIYHPDPTPPSLAAAGVEDLQEVAYRTGDGLALRSWYAPAPEGRPTMLFFHGNGGNIGGMAGHARLYHGAGYGVLLAEYRGYGGNPGSPDEQGLYADGRAALRFLGDRGIAPASVIVYGVSLGTGVATRIAAEAAERGAPVAALVLESPYLSVARAASERYPWVPVDLLLEDRFDSESRIATVAAPVIIVHGARDRTIPVHHGHGLFEQARSPKSMRVFAKAGHNDLHGHGARRWILDALARIGL